MTSAFHKFDLQTLGGYIDSTESISKHLGGSSSAWKISEIGDGNLNFVYSVEAQEKDADNKKLSIIIKQAVPYIRIFGEGNWPLTQMRAYYEYMAMSEHTKCSKHIPILHHYDPEHCLIAMQKLEPHIVLRKGIISGIKYPNLAKHMAHHLAQTLFKTSLLGTPISSKKIQEQAFIGNRPLCAVSEQVIFTDPYIEANLNKWNSPYLDEDVKKIKADDELKSAVSTLKFKFCDSPEALIHGDLHTGSVMVTETETYVIDFEFAFYGPMGFDIGAFIGNLFLAYFAQEGYKEDRSEYRNWILEQIDVLWARFSKRFIKLWNTEHDGDVYSPKSFFSSDVVEKLQQKYMLSLLHDTIGFAGVKMIRRLIGVAHVADFESIEDPLVRSKSERKALQFASGIIVNRSSYSTLKQLVNLARDQ